jgi:hypothetical protein
VLGENFILAEESITEETLLSTVAGVVLQEVEDFQRVHVEGDMTLRIRGRLG